MSKRRRGELSQAVEISASLIGLMFLVWALQVLLPLDLRVLGILPRTLRGLLGILFSPLLHLSLAHLLANALPLFVLLLLLFAHREYDPEWALSWIWLGSGLGTWLIGRGNAVHIGASSLIYGLVVYLVSAAWWMRTWRPAWIAMLVLLLYGGIFFGVLPHRGMVSWEGHLAGAIAGWFAARWIHA
jgi:membrane associated rhomboid family serine protease